MDKQNSKMNTKIVVAPPLNVKVPSHEGTYLAIQA